MEDGGRNEENSRPEDQADRDMRARAGIRRPFRSRHDRIRERAIRRGEDGGYVAPVEGAGDSATYISRVREDPTVENGLNLWCVSDNLRKGAALNAVQIAELLGRRHLQKG